LSTPFRFLLIAVAGWMNQQQQFAIDYLREENRSGRDRHAGYAPEVAPEADCREVRWDDTARARSTWHRRHDRVLGGSNGKRKL
jgi:hypothetical protein